jgi:hypothetical protein
MVVDQERSSHRSRSVGACVVEGEAGHEGAVPATPTALPARGTRVGQGRVGAGKIIRFIHWTRVEDMAPVSRDKRALVGACAGWFAESPA